MSPSFRPDSGDTSLGHLVMRYLYAYGPSTPQHFARWLSIPPRIAVALFDELGGDLEHVEKEGEPAWVTVESSPSPWNHLAS
jgi:hypothetical protein